VLSKAELLLKKGKLKMQKIFGKFFIMLNKKYTKVS